MLEETFEKQKYVSVKERVIIATQLGLSEQNVKTWFQNRRTKWKKDEQKGTTKEKVEQGIEIEEKSSGSSEED